MSTHVKKSSKMSCQSCSKINTKIFAKVAYKIWAGSIIFKKTAQRKESPNWQKFATSGHPVCVEL
jgi:hypothetical protein